MARDMPVGRLRFLKHVQDRQTLYEHSSEIIAVRRIICTAQGREQQRLLTREAANRAFSVRGRGGTSSWGSFAVHVIETTNGEWLINSIGSNRRHDSAIPPQPDSCINV